MVKPVKIPKFAGINNRLPDFENQVGDDHFLRNAVNVDLTNAGTVRRRKGSERVQSGDDCHSFFARGEDAYYIDYDTLYHLSTTFVRTSVMTVVPGRRGSFCELNNDVVFSNGQTIQRLEGATSGDLGVPMPTFLPVIATGTGGSLSAGKYLVAITHVSSSGEESGSTVPVQVDVVAGGTITISNLDSDVATPRVYLSPPNGDILFRVAEPSGDSIVITVQPDYNGKRCTTLLLAPMPAGDIVRYSNGRLLVASGRFLYYSEPYAPALRNPARGWIYFEEPIRMMEPVEGGVYVAAKDTVFLAGADIEKAAYNVVLPYSAALGASGAMPDKKGVWWMSARGVVVGDDRGGVKNIQEANVVVNPATQGAVLYREQDGLKQMIASLFGPEQSIATAQSWMDAEIVRKETVL